MNRYLKLVNMEIGRFAKIYIGLFIATLLLQAGSVWLKAREIVNAADKEIAGTMKTYADYAAQHGKVNFANELTDRFMLSSALCATVILLYVFLIWYRDWMGKNTFVYRLLMLPTSRRNIYLAKLTTIVLFVLGLIAFQLLILPLEMGMFNAIVPADLRETVSILDLIHYGAPFILLMPRSFLEFLVYYGIGTIAVSILFTAILIERSFKLKGLIGGLIYAAVSVIVMAAPFIVWDSHYLYPDEMFFLELVLLVLNGCASFGLGFYLINKKVTV